jgi:hypothetical protein
MKDDQWFVVMNNTPLKIDCDDMGPVLFSPDSGHIIYTIKRDDRWMVVIDGDVKSEYEYIYWVKPGADAVEYMAKRDGCSFRCRQNYPSVDGGKLIQEKIDGPRSQAEFENDTANINRKIFNDANQVLAHTRVVQQTQALWDYLF